MEKNNDLHRAWSELVCRLVGSVAGWLLCSVFGWSVVGQLIGIEKPTSAATSPATCSCDA